MYLSRLFFISTAAKREAAPDPPPWRKGSRSLRPLLKSGRLTPVALPRAISLLGWWECVCVCVCVSIHSEIFLFLHHHTSSLRLPLSVGGDTSGILRSPISVSAVEISLSWKCTTGGRAGHHYDLKSISITDLFHSLTPFPTSNLPLLPDFVTVTHLQKWFAISSGLAVI